MRLMNADGGALLRCRMYSGFADLWEGFSKNLRPAFEESFTGFVLFLIVCGGLFLCPFFLLLFAIFSGKGCLFPLGAVLIILLMRLLLTLRFKASWLGLPGHPVAVVLILLIALNSWRLCCGKGVRWKGRTYAGATRSSLE